MYAKRENENRQVSINSREMCKYGKIKSILKEMDESTLRGEDISKWEITQHA